MILNLTQHMATPEQLVEGVVEPDNKAEVQKLLNFTSSPPAAEIHARAEALAKIAEKAGANKAMIGGANYLMSALERSLLAVGCQPVYSFTQRVSKEEVTPEGVKKTSTFVHTDWVELT